MVSDVAFLVLNTIYLKKMGTRADVATISGLSFAEVDEQTKAFLADGKLLETPTGMLLMPSGTEAVLDYYRHCYEDVRKSSSAVHWYERFEAINTRFIALVSEWQKSEGEKVQDRIFQQVEKLTKLLGELVDRFPRYGQYIERFERSMSLVDRGEKQYVCNPTVDSVHNIWFEFHEDILAVLGRPRDTT
jgi:hypothetical protein